MRERSPRHLLQAALTALAVASCATTSPQVAHAQVPEGMNPYIYGMHDTPDHALFERAGCARGWVTELRYIGADSQCDAIDMTGLTSKGFGVIMRLDFNGTIAQPPNSSDWDGYARAFAECVRKSRGVRVWVVGNEPNIPWGHPENRSFRGEEYGQIYARVLGEVNKLPNAGEHEILFAAMAPWAAIEPWGYWDDGLRQAIDAAGVIDGVAIHAYTRARYEPSAITSDEWFPNPAVRGRWHHHFRSYRDTLDILRGRNKLDIPLYITESGNACDPPCAPYPDVDNGYFFAMFEEIHNWNMAHPDQVIRAVTPYRWTQNDDGSGRDFCIGCKGAIKADIGRAIDQGWSWTQDVCSNQTPQCVPRCSGRECGEDGCGGQCGVCRPDQACDGSGACASTRSDMGQPVEDMSASFEDMNTIEPAPDDMSAASSADLPNLADHGGEVDLSGGGAGEDTDSTPGASSGETITSEGSIGCASARGAAPTGWLIGLFLLLFGARGNGQRRSDRTHS